MKKFYLSIILVLALASCSPYYETRYNFIPPHNYNGQMCANECIYQVNQCEMYCNNNHNSCVTNMAMMDSVRSIMRDRKKDPYYYEYDHSYRCDNAKRSCIDSCNANHRLCHTNCGGVVEQYSVCVYGCS